MSRVSPVVSSRPGHVRERLIGALIPNALASRRGEDVSVPLPALPTLSTLDNLSPAALLVSTARMDRSGRVHERILLRELGWDPGRQLDMDTLHGLILIAAAPAGQRGQHIVDHRGAIKIPASLRRLCGIEYGPPVVLAAAVPDQVMVVHPSATVAQLLAAHYTDLIRTSRAHTEPDPTEPDPADGDAL
ncbi:hypothetical protein [Actinophytocola sp.]|uniref:hypothetical protein n=1 Tax=Actinophytocola sp. TaxID=1872138 RepID=UPI003D6BE60A